MTALARRAAVGGRPLARLGLLASALALGAAIALAPWMTLVAAVALGLLVLVAVHPPAGAIMVIVASLLLAGIDRGVVVPFLRPQEAVLGLVLAGLAVHAGLGAVSGRLRLALRFDRIDAAIIAMAFAASVLPLGFMLVRGREIEAEDFLYALQLWKLYAVFVVVRVGVRTPAEVNRCLWVIMGAATVVGLVGILQALGIGPVESVLERYFNPTGEDGGSIDLTRATSLVGSPFAVGDTMIFSGAIAAALLVRRHPRRLVLASLAALFLFSAVAAGQFSIAIGIVVAVLAFGVTSRRLGRSLAALLVLSVIAGLALQPVIENRLRSFENSAGIPRSWQGRIDNLEDFFLPHMMSELNWVTGVRPAARVPAPENWRDWVYIESGYVWLLWTGGLALMAAFCVFMVLALDRTGRVARARRDAVGAAAMAALTAFWVVAVLMILDVHLTLRGAGELMFTLLALGLSGPPE